jgi:hypothetical protein
MNKTLYADSMTCLLWVVLQHRFVGLSLIYRLRLLRMASGEAQLAQGSSTLVWGEASYGFPRSFTNLQFQQRCTRSLPLLPYHHQSLIGTEWNLNAILAYNSLIVMNIQHFIWVPRHCTLKTDCSMHSLVNLAFFVVLFCFALFFSRQGFSV